MTALDARVNAVRADLADARLRGQVQAARFVDGDPAHVVVGVAALREAPDISARQGSELLFGERVLVFDRSQGWAWVRNDVDGYVGYLDETCLGGAEAHAPTHWVSALRSYLFDTPDLKTRPRDVLHMTTAVAVVDVDGGWAQIADGGWLWAAHLTKTGAWERDPVAVARRFMGAPYAWGGRSSIGLDCSALIQIAFSACGRSSPRDSDMQEDQLGEAIDGMASARPGDLLFWPGHVAFLTEGSGILHANAHHMAVAEEPLSDFRARTLDRIGDVRTVRRVGL